MIHNKEAQLKEANLSQGVSKSKEGNMTNKAWNSCTREELPNFQSL